MGATRLVSLIASALLIVAGFSALFTVNQTHDFNKIFIIKFINFFLC